MKIWESIDNWWQDKETQNAKKEFITNYAKTSENLTSEFIRIVKDNNVSEYTI